MASVNRVILLGNLGADPEVRFTPGGQAVANFRIATSESWTDKNTGQKQERTEWHRVTVWGKQAELCGEYLKKGRQVYVEGKLTTREWEKDGVKRQSTEIVASEVKFLGSREGGQAQQGGRQGQSGGYSQQARQAVANVQAAFPGAEPTDNDDIPF